MPNFRPRSRLAPALVVACLALALLGTYVACYLFGYGVARTELPRAARARTFRAGWQCAVFWPAAWAETKLTGDYVFLYDEIGMLHTSTEPSIPYFPRPPAFAAENGMAP